MKQNRAIKGLICCGSAPECRHDCERMGCPYTDMEDCLNVLFRDTLGLLKSYNAKIIMLKKERQALRQQLREAPPWD